MNAVTNLPGEVRVDTARMDRLSDALISQTRDDRSAAQARAALAARLRDRPARLRWGALLIVAIGIAVLLAGWGYSIAISARVKTVTKEIPVPVEIIKEVVREVPVPLTRTETRVISDEVHKRQDALRPAIDACLTKWNRHYIQQDYGEPGQCLPLNVPGPGGPRSINYCNRATGDIAGTGPCVRKPS